MHPGYEAYELLPSDSQQFRMVAGMVRTACLLLLAVVACDAACITEAQGGAGCSSFSGWSPSQNAWNNFNYYYCCGASSSPAGYYCQTSGECNNAGGPSPPPPPAPGPSYAFRNAYWVCGGKKGSKVVMNDGDGDGTGNNPDWSAGSSSSFASDQVKGTNTVFNSAVCSSTSSEPGVAIPGSGSWLHTPQNGCGCGPSGFWSSYKYFCCNAWPGDPGGGAYNQDTVFGYIYDTDASECVPCYAKNQYAGCTSKDKSSKPNGPCCGYCSEGCPGHCGGADCSCAAGNFFQT